MNESLLQLDIFGNRINDIVGSNMFAEFCYGLDFLDSLGSPHPFLEVVVDAPTGAKKHVSKIVKNTKDTTRDVGKAYIGVVDANAGVIKGTWDLVMKFINIAVSAFRSIMQIISKIPPAIGRTIDKIGNIPNDIRNKIKGNIKLYITVDDLSMLYNQSLIVRLDTFISTLALLSQGNMWGTLFRRNKITVQGFKMDNNDMELCRKLNKIYRTIENIRFEPTVIEMTDQNVINTYFGTEKSIKFTDLRGQKHEGSYFECLQQLLKDIEARKSDMEKLEQSLGGKYSQTQLNQQFAQMGAIAQTTITETIQHVAKAISIVGNILRYISIDISTMESTINKLLEKGKISTGPNGAKKNDNNQKQPTK